VIVVDPRKERNCVREARIIGAKVIGVLDTDCDPDAVDLPIPANDDSIRSVRLILGYLADAINDGKSHIPKEPEKQVERPEYKPIPSL
jgi:small subunit ribosomal protein S2